MAHADFQTPVGEIAPYIARQTDVPIGTDAGTLKVLLRAPPNANVQLVCLSAYGAWGLNILPYVYLIPPAGSTELAVGSPNSYCLFSHAGDLGAGGWAKWHDERQCGHLLSRWDRASLGDIRSVSD